MRKSTFAINRKRTLALIICLLLVPIITTETSAQAVTKTKKKKNNASPSLAKPVVDKFLRTWLEAKNINQALLFFHPKAFENKLLLPDSWLGKEWGAGGKNGTRAVRNIVRKVLGDVSKIAGKQLKLKKILSIERWDKGDEQIFRQEFSAKDLRLLSELKKDHYILVEADDLRTVAQEQLDWKYITSKYPASKYVAAIIDIYPKRRTDGFEAIMYFLWAKHANKWQIILFGVYGM